MHAAGTRVAGRPRAMPTGFGSFARMLEGRRAVVHMHEHAGAQALQFVVIPSRTKARQLRGASSSHSRASFDSAAAIATNDGMTTGSVAVGCFGGLRSGAHSRIEIRPWNEPRLCLSCSFVQPSRRRRPRWRCRRIQRRAASLRCRRSRRRSTPTSCSCNSKAPALDGPARRSRWTIGCPTRRTRLRSHRTSRRSRRTARGSRTSTCRRRGARRRARRS